MKSKFKYRFKNATEYPNGIHNKGWNVITRQSIHYLNNLIHTNGAIRCNEFVKWKI